MPASLCRAFLERRQSAWTRKRQFCLAGRTRQYQTSLSWQLLLHCGDAVPFRIVVMSAKLMLPPAYLRGHRHGMLAPRSTLSIPLTMELDAVPQAVFNRSRRSNKMFA